MQLTLRPAPVPPAAAPGHAPQDPPPRFALLVAEQLMAAPVEGLPRVVPVAHARDLLRFSRHHGFPVYDPAHHDSAVRRAQGPSAVLLTRTGPGCRAACPAVSLSLLRTLLVRPRPALLQSGSFRAEGFIVRSQLEMLLATPEAYCDAVSSCCACCAWHVELG